MSDHLCADGVRRQGIGQWQGYLSAAAGDPDEAARRLAEVPDALRPLVESHWRSTQVLHWVGRVWDCIGLDARRAMLQQCPADLRDDVRGHVALLFGLRAKARRTAP
jgi:hypothetical protein